MLLIVTDWVIVPEVAVPKSMLEGFAVTTPGVTPLPWTLRERTEPDASLINSNVPSTCPLALGLKLAVKGTLSPGDNVSGKLKPLILKPEPAGFTADTVIWVEARFVRVAGTVVVWPTKTMSNHSWPGLQLSLPALASDGRLVDCA
jgi:hypothetical protein